MAVGDEGQLPEYAQAGFGNTDGNAGHDPAIACTSGNAGGSPAEVASATKVGASPTKARAGKRR